MAAQERRARRDRWAAKKAATIVAETTQKVRATPPPPSQNDQPALVRQMRDEKKMSWMAIGKELGLPGAKFGAGAARKLYAQANNGVVPRSQAPRKGTTPRPQGPGKSGTLLDRKTQLVNNGHVIPRDMPDDEVVSYVKGHTIQWAIDLARLTRTDPETWGTEEKRFMTQEARVHPDWCVMDEPDSKGNRVLRFRELHGRDKEGRLMCGPTRTVRVDAIYTVR